VRARVGLGDLVPGGPLVLSGGSGNPAAKPRAELHRMDMRIGRPFRADFRVLWRSAWADHFVRDPPPAFTTGRRGCQQSTLRLGEEFHSSNAREAGSGAALPTGAPGNPYAVRCRKLRDRGTALLPARLIPERTIKAKAGALLFPQGPLVKGRISSIRPVAAGKNQKAHFHFPKARGSKIRGGKFPGGLLAGVANVGWIDNRGPPTMGVALSFVPR